MTPDIDAIMAEERLHRAEIAARNAAWRRRIDRTMLERLP
jgi:uncharacterized membrane protein